MRPFLLAIALCAPSLAADPVLLASRRGGTIDAISPETLETVARIQMPGMPESVAADVNGQWLFIAHHDRDKPCCGLFALDLQSMQMSLLVQPAMNATVDADRIFTQRGAVGIDTFDAQNLNRLPTMKAPGNYRLRASPDGRLLLGITYWRQTSLDSFDVARGVMIASQTIPGATNLAGAWLGQQYYLFGLQAGYPKLWPIDPNGGAPAPGVALTPANLQDCVETPYDMIASGAKLAIYAQFGLKSSGSCAAPGGFVLADPVTGAATRLTPDTHFRQMVASPDGKYLYGLDVGVPRVVKIQRDNGQVMASKSLPPDVWYLTSGQIPHEIAGRLDLAAIAPK